MEQLVSPSGRSKINLSDFGKDMIRYEFHLLLAERVYPTLDSMMTRLLADFLDFPIKSRTILSKELKQIGFVYRKTSMIKTPLESTFFMSQRAKYFRRIDKLRIRKKHSFSITMKRGVIRMKKKQVFGSRSGQDKEDFVVQKEKVCTVKIANILLKTTTISYGKLFNDNCIILNTYTNSYKLEKRNFIIDHFS
jgi:hypothetical protein